MGNKNGTQGRHGKMINNDNDYSIDTVAAILNVLLNRLYWRFWTFDCGMRFEDKVTRKSKKRFGKKYGLVSVWSDSVIW